MQHVMSKVKVKVEKLEVNTGDTSKSNRGRGGGYRRGHVSTAKLNENCASLAERVYDISHGQADRYIKTTDENTWERSIITAQKFDLLLRPYSYLR